MSSERDRLIPVKIFNIYPYAEGQQALGMPQNFLVFLKGEENRVVPITIGQFEGQALLMAMRRIPLPRPLPHNLLQNLLEKMNAKVHKLVIHTLKDDVFHAYLLIETQSETFYLDCRPSDGMVLASLIGLPIYMSPEVMGEAGRVLEIEQSEEPGQQPSVRLASPEEVHVVSPAGEDVVPAEEGPLPESSRGARDQGTELAKLRAQLTRLIAEEAYEEAARIRDQINELERN
ncbi:MAG: bifunctional nuclease family protein [Candidatus Latescibacterota bacterium]